MGRIMAIDYGGKRTGVAVTDPMRIIATPHSAVPTKELKNFITQYCEVEDVDILVVGQPTRHDGSFSDIEQEILPFIAWVEKTLPLLVVERINEMYTSKLAVEALIQSGTTKNQRKNKALIDKTSAAIMLQEYMEQL